MAKIKSVKATEILDSRGNPTIETEVTLDIGIVSRASIPSGASCGKFEAVELRDYSQARYFGKGVIRAINNVNHVISHELIGLDVSNQKKIDDLLISLDGTQDKSNLGANALLSVSMAVFKANKEAMRLPYYAHILPNNTDYRLPVPLINLINGGKHAENDLAIQEIMVVPMGFSSFREAIMASAEVFYTLKDNLQHDNWNTSVGDEGGFAPNIGSTELCLDYLMRSIEDANYIPGKHFFLALDSAASDFYSPNEGYKLSKQQVLSSDEMLDYYISLINKYPIFSIEDPFSEIDRDPWISLTQKVGDKLQIVGDDIFVTNSELLSEGIKDNVGNAILVKPNQIGTISETFDTIALAKSNNYKVVPSHRSGETEDTIITHLAIATDCDQIKIGSLSRSERVGKYNEILRIEDKLSEISPEKVNFVGKSLLKK